MLVLKKLSPKRPQKVVLAFMCDDMVENLGDVTTKQKSGNSEEPKGDQAIWSVYWETEFFNNKDLKDCIPRKLNQKTFLHEI